MKGSARVTLPLQPAAGGVLSVGFSLGHLAQRGTVDTGSPYLMVASETSADSRSTGLPTTREVYGQVEGSVAWLEGPLLSSVGTAPQQVVFGAAGGQLLAETGGPLFGLIKRSRANADSIRPTLLDQLRLRGDRPVVAFEVDAPRRRLTLSPTPLLPRAADAVPLRDLRPLGDVVEHYAARVASLRVDGVETAAGRLRRGLVCVFDTGLTGCVMSDALCAELGLRADPSGRIAASRLELALPTEHGRTLELGSSRGESPLFYVQRVSLDWFAAGQDEAPHVIALGMAFLGDGALTIDADDRRVWFRPTGARSRYYASAPTSARASVDAYAS